MYLLFYVFCLLTCVLAACPALDFLGQVEVDLDVFRDVLFTREVEIDTPLRPAGSGSIQLKLFCTSGKGGKSAKDKGHSLADDSSVEKSEAQQDEDARHYFQNKDASVVDKAAFNYVRLNRPSNKSFHAKKYMQTRFVNKNKVGNLALKLVSGSGISLPRKGVADVYATFTFGMSTSSSRTWGDNDPEEDR